VSFDDCFGFILAFILLTFGIIIGIVYSMKITLYFFSRATKITEQCVHTNIWEVVDLSNEQNNLDDVNIDIVIFHQDNLDKQLL
jgi:hypothetical protein